jgi:hypothetical protein
MAEDTFKVTDAHRQRQMLIEWLHGHYQDATKGNLAEFVWCLDTKGEEDTCLSISGYTAQQIRDDIEKKNLPLHILRVFRTDIPFEDQVRDL